MHTIIGFFGYGTKHIAKALERKGGTRAASPKGFMVAGKEGPLEDGELEAAAE